MVWNIRRYLNRFIGLTLNRVGLNNLAVRVNIVNHLVSIVSRVVNDNIIQLGISSWVLNAINMSNVWRVAWYCWSIDCL